jgi:ABC-type uncharacterized transport system substrate-binding protein
LKETVPAASRIAVLFNADDPVTEPQIRESERAAPQVGVEIRFFPVRSQDGLIVAFQELVDWRADALLWLSGQERVFMEATIKFAAKQKLPTSVVRRFIAGQDREAEPTRE